MWCSTFRNIHILEEDILPHFFNEIYINVLVTNPLLHCNKTRISHAYYMDYLYRFNKIAIQCCKVQMASGQGSL